MLASGGQEIFLIVVPLFLLIGILGFLSRAARSGSIIEKWARENGFELLESNRAYFTTAFMFTHSKGQTLYRVRVRDAQGRERSGVLRCGSYMGGVTWSSEATIKWDD